MVTGMQVYQLVVLWCVVVMIFAAQVVELLLLLPLVMVFCYAKDILKIKISKPLLGVVLCFSSLILISATDLEHGLVTAFYFGNTLIIIATAYVSITKYSTDTLRSAVEVTIALYCVAMFYFLYLYWGHREPFGEIIPGSSTNGLPAYLLVLIALFCVTSVATRRSVNLIWPSLGMVIAFYGNGRGSLIVGFLLLILSMAYNTRVGLRKSGWFGKFFFLAALVSLIGVAFSALIESYDFIFRNTKLSVGLLDENRLEIFRDYAGSIDGWQLLFGGSYHGTVIEELYEGNPHIAFIRLHYLFGFIPLMLALASPLFVFVRKFSEEKFWMFLFIFAIWLRAVTEPVFFPTALDFFYVMMLMLAMRVDHELVLKKMPKERSPGYG